MTSKCIRACTIAVAVMVCGSGAFAPAGALRGAGLNEHPIEGQNAPSRISPNSVITWWSHDATGYHPALGLVLENSSGRDLSGTLIRFQGRFLDLRNGYTQVAREEIDDDFRRNQQRFIKLRGPVPYELPIDKENWPRIECKVMCRVGNVSDEGTQDLLVTRIDRITMTDEEAMERLRQDMGKRVQRPPSQSHPGHHHADNRKHPSQRPAEPAKPLVATAGSLRGAFNGGAGQAVSRLLNIAKMPALGDDFFDYEQAFKRPVETDAKDAQWTWARFSPDSRIDIIVGSKGRTGKADVVVAVIPATEVQGEAQVLNLAQLLARGQRPDKLKGPQYSVRYVPQGRVQVGALTGTGVRGLVFHPRGSAPDANNYIIELTRLPDDLDNLMAKECRRVTMLRFYLPMSGIDVDKN